jgi:hypothetical protein
MKNKTIKKSIKNKKKKNKTKQVRFAKNLEHYQTYYNPIKIPETSKCVEPAKEVKNALVYNVLYGKN